MVDAAELGSKNAMKLVSQYYAEGFGTEMNEYQADIWLKSIKVALKINHTIMWIRCMPMLPVM